MPCASLIHPSPTLRRYLRRHPPIETVSFQSATPPFLVPQARHPDPTPKPDMVQYWRAAGMTYLKYSNTCADLVRQALKEPIRAKILNRTGFSMVKGQWEGGKIVQRTTIEPTTVEAVAAK